MTINNKSERNYRGKCLGSPVTSYGGVFPLICTSSYALYVTLFGISFIPVDLALSATVAPRALNVS